MLKYKIYSYFFKELLKNFLIVLFSLTLLLWLAQSGKLLDMITTSGISIEVYLKYILFLFPKILRQLILISFFVSLFYSIVRFKNLNELSNYWLSGVSKSKIIKLIFIFGFLIFIFYIILSVYIAPYSSFKGRELLASAEFKIINSLVKEKNFNSPIKNINIYVDENDKNGNLKKIFIYENNRTIIAKTGRVILNDNKFTLELKNGFTHEENNGNISVIKFDSTIFDVSNYKPSLTDYPKFSERSINWLLNQLNNSEYKKHDLLEEINKRFFYPLFIFLLCIVSCFIVVKNFEKLSSEKYKFFIFSLGIVFMILNEALLTISGNNYKKTLLYVATPITLTLILFLVLKILLKNENKINL